MPTYIYAQSDDHTNFVEVSHSMSEVGDLKDETVSEITTALGTDNFRKLLSKPALLGFVDGMSHPILGTNHTGQYAEAKKAKALRTKGTTRAGSGANLFG